MRGLALIGALALVACGSEPIEVVLGASEGPPPVSLSELAVDVRESGGVVFVGNVVAGPVPAESAYVPAPYEGLRVELPRSEATVRVIDALGETIAPELQLLGVAGPAALVDAEGRPSERYVISGDSERWRTRELPYDGTWLFFVYVDGEERIVGWRAAVTDGVASGEGTQMETDVPLEALHVVD